MRFSALMHNSRLYDVDAKAHFDRLSVLDNQLMNDLDVLIRMLKTIGVWVLKDVISVVHIGEADSLLNLKGALFDATNVNGCAFDEGLGFTPNGGTSSYINTNFIPAAAGILADKSDSFFIYRNAFTEGEFARNGAYQSVDNRHMALETSELTLITSSPESHSYYSQQLSGVVTNNGLVASGFIGGTHRVNNELEARSDSANNIRTGVGSNGLLNTIPLFVGARNVNGIPDSYSSSRFSCWGAGGGLTSQQLSGLRDAIQVYMVARGAQML